MTEQEQIEALELEIIELRENDEHDKARRKEEMLNLMLEHNHGICIGCQE